MNQQILSLALKSSHQVARPTKRLLYNYMVQKISAHAFTSISTFVYVGPQTGILQTQRLDVTLQISNIYVCDTHFLYIYLIKRSINPMIHLLSC